MHGNHAFPMTEQQCVCKLKFILLMELDTVKICLNMIIYVYKLIIFKFSNKQLTPTYMVKSYGILKLNSNIVPDAYVNTYAILITINILLHAY